MKNATQIVFGLVVSTARASGCRPKRSITLDMASPWTPQAVELLPSRRVVLQSRVLGVLLICFGIAAKLGTSGGQW
jgi:hypothetical protein